MALNTLLDSLNTPSFAWVAAAVVFAILELVLPYFGLIFAALAALVAAGVSTQTPHPLAAAIAFALALLAGLLLLRPKLVHRLQSKKHLPSRTESLKGRTGQVTTAISGTPLQGRVEVDGQDWAATSIEPLAIGTSVVIEGADGIVLQVKKG